MPASPPIPSDPDDAPEGAAAAPDELVTISRWELEALRAQAAGASIRPAEEAPAAPFAEPAAVAPPAPATAPIAADGRASEMERLYRSAVRDRELATALAGRPLVPGAAGQLLKLWREDFDVIDEGGELRVVSRDGRPVSKAVADRLAEAEYAHFAPPPSRGGAAARGTARPSDPTPEPWTLGEAALLRWREAASTRTDPAHAPIGLRRR